MARLLILADLSLRHPHVQRDFADPRQGTWRQGSEARGWGAQSG